MKLLCTANPAANLVYTLMGCQEVLGEASTLIFFELRLEAEGVLRVVDLPKFMTGDEIPCFMHLTVGGGAKVNARGVWFMTVRSCLRTYPFDITSQVDGPGVNVALTSNHHLTAHLEPCSSAFDGYRGRLVFVRKRQVVVMDYV